MSSMICLICLRSKRCLGCELRRLKPLVGNLGWSFKSNRPIKAIPIRTSGAVMRKDNKFARKSGQNRENRGLTAKNASIAPPKSSLASAGRRRFAMICRYPTDSARKSKGL